MKKRLLVYTQDVGGTRCLMPLLEEIEKEFPETLYVRHSLSESVFKSRAFEPQHLQTTSFPLAEKKWTEILKQSEATHVLCTLSSPHFDLTNCRLIQAARKSKIPTFSFMDHWKGYDRFYDEQGQPSFFTDWIGCPDRFVRDELLKRGLSTSRLPIVGHPGLEFLLNHGLKKKAHRGEMKILVVSQPVTHDQSFHGIFFRKNGSRPILEKLIENLSSPQSQLFYRPHPKEKPAELPKGIIKAPSFSLEESFVQYDLFLGLSSMMLFEASLVGLSCLLLEIPEFLDLHDVPVPYHYGKIVRGLDALKQSCADLLANDFRNEKEHPEPYCHKLDIEMFRRQLPGSLDRSRKLLRQFVDQPHALFQ